VGPQPLHPVQRRRRTHASLPGTRRHTVDLDAVTLAYLLWRCRTAGVPRRRSPIPCRQRLHAQPALVRERPPDGLEDRTVLEVELGAWSDRLRAVVVPPAHSATVTTALRSLKLEDRLARSQTRKSLRLARGALLTDQRDRRRGPSKPTSTDVRTRWTPTRRLGCERAAIEHSSSPTTSARRGARGPVPSTAAPSPHAQRPSRVVDHPASTGHQPRLA